MTTVSVAPARTAWSARGWAIYLGWAVITLDGSALNLTLPTIAQQLDAQAGGASWVVDAYTLPLASLLLFGGSLGDRIGAQRLFKIGALGFAMASVGCALSPSLAVLIVCRAAQGVFAALLLPMILALVGKSFDDPAHRATAVNLLAVFGGSGMAIGPFLGGLLTDTASWRAVFWLTVPIAVTATVLAGHTDGPGDSSRRLHVDLPGQLTGTAGLVALVAGLIEAGSASSPFVSWGLISLGALLLCAFVAIEHRVTMPMMPLSVFRAPGFPGAVLGGFALQFGAYGLQFFLAVYLQAAWGVTAFTGGLLLASFAIGVVLAGVVINPALQRRGARAMTLTGATVAGIGTLALLLVSGGHMWWLLLLAEFVIGIGTGIYSTALNQTASCSLGYAAAGLGSGIYNTARQVGQSIGIAILGSFAHLTNQSLGFSMAIILVTGCAAAIVVTELRPRTTPGR